VVGLLKWFRKLIPPLTADRRKQIIGELIPAASPGFDFFLLVVLSCSIATLGLITDSPAVIIGAMLLAPLMSPIIGLGLASLIGDAKFLKNALSALLRGALLAILLAVVVTWVNNQLPFISMQELPKEVLSRTRPTPIDLAIALAGGLAAAYAMTQPNLSAALPGVAIATALMPPLCTVGIGIALGRWEVMLGALLLFLTNAVTIAFSAVLVFFVRGFSSAFNLKNGHLPRSLIYSAILVTVLLVPLSYFSVRFFREASQNRLVQTVLASEVSRLDGVELVDAEIDRSGETMDIIITVRTGIALRYEQVVALQKAIVSQINEPISLKVNQVFAERLDPLVPPTRTPTMTLVPTGTSGPSPTSTNSPTPTFTATATATATFTITPTATSTPAQANVVTGVLPRMQIYQTPGGAVIGALKVGQSLTVLPGREIYRGIVWVEIMDAEGRVGWLPEVYLEILEPAPTPNATLIPEPGWTANPEP
jgi:uncharacterized hydrophobic protein (TIGR00271 family)